MKPIDYSQTIMYKLVPKDLNSKLVYVGHTTNFRQRKYIHKGRCNCINDVCYNFKVYQMIRENGGWEEWEMIEIEKFPCIDGNEARTRERYWYELYNANLNSKVPILFLGEQLEKDKVYRKETRKITTIKQKIYREKNKDVINAKRKEYLDKTKDVRNARRREKRQEKKLALKLEENSVGV